MLKNLLIVSVIVLVAFASGSTISLTKIDPLISRLNNGGDTTFVLNFWATWCAPCVAELHYFTDLDSIKPIKPLKVILVSLDFKKDISTKLVPFLKKRKIKTEVVFLDETNDNFWIPKIDKNWQGNIPATLIQNKLKSYFIPRATSYRELDSLLKISY